MGVFEHDFSFSPDYILSQIQWVSANWSGGVPASSPSFPCSASDGTPVLSVDTSHTVTEALSATIAHSTCFTLGHLSVTPGSKFCEGRCTLNSLLDLRVFKSGVWEGRRQPLSPPAGFRLPSMFTGQQKLQTPLPCSEGLMGSVFEKRQEHPFSLSPLWCPCEFQCVSMSGWLDPRSSEWLHWSEACISLHLSLILTQRNFLHYCG